MHQVEDNPSSYVRVPARVFGCLRGGEITVFLLIGHGLVLTQPIQTHLVPESLRMPPVPTLFVHDFVCIAVAKAKKVIERATLRSVTGSILTTLAVAIFQRLGRERGHRPYKE